MLATHPHRWSSIDTTASFEGWHMIDRAKRVVSLKDLRKVNGKYKNTMIDSVTYKYELPGGTRVDDIFCNAETRKNYQVHLFGALHARDHYLGEWTPETYVEKREGAFPYVLLRRNKVQRFDDIYASHKRARRSNNENTHQAILEAAFPEYHVLYEPECTANLAGRMVTDGIFSECAGNSYLIDFILAERNGCRRISVESKYERDAVTEEALGKCRALRDRCGQRVIVIAGSGGNEEFLDLGPPLRQPAVEVWHDTVEALKEAIGA